jgi:hypothetical protein
MERLKIVLGAVLTLPPLSPGMVWNWMQQAQGLLRLGHDLTFVEEVDSSWCVDSSGRPASFESSVNRRLFLKTMERFGLQGRACQLLRGSDVTSGLAFEALKAAVADADVLINMSGHIQSAALLEGAARRVYFDQDPVYTQLWSSEYGKELGFAAHDVFFTVGLNIGTPLSPIPDCGIAWNHTLPVVVIDQWPNSPGPSDGRFTTIASWSGYGDLFYQGDWYRSKYEEFMRFAELPRHSSQPLEVLLKSFAPDDEGVGRLLEGGWRVDHGARASDLDSYQAYIRGSRAEIGIAKNAYVRGRSGWFSDRSAHYLASGRPVLAQSTGFEHCLPTGEGLLTFRDLDEAAAGMEAINSDYERHRRAARGFAEEFLDYRKVLPAFLDDCFSSRTSGSVAHA